jgi:hypothetical protein
LAFHQEVIHNSKLQCNPFLPRKKRKARRKKIKKIRRRSPSDEDYLSS